MLKLKVEIKRGKKDIVALKLTGPQAFAAPAAFTNYFDLKKNYAEIPPTVYAYDKLQIWAQEQGLELDPVPAVTRWLEKEAARREQYNKFNQIQLTDTVTKDLYEHQVTALKRAAANSLYRGTNDEICPPVRLLLADDPRLGKSAEALRIIKAHTENGMVLILCPKALIEQWVDYVNRWLPYSIVNTLKGTAKERLEDLHRIVYIS